MIRLSPSEIEEGEANIQCTPDRAMELSRMSSGRHVIPIIPSTGHDAKKYSAVLLISDAERLESRKLKIKFRPVWCRVFSVCASRKDTIKAIIIETSDGKHWIDEESIRTCDLTTNGPGCDPTVINDAECALGQLLANQSSNRVVLRLTDFIRKRF